MLMKWLKQLQIKSVQKNETVETVLTEFKQSNDFAFFTHQEPVHYTICYLTTMVDSNRLHRDCLPYINKYIREGLAVIKSKVPIEDITITTDVATVKQKILEGCIVVKLASTPNELMLIKARASFDREVSPPEIEFTVTGPQEAFVESLETNLNLIRKRLPLAQLKVKQIEVGKLSKTKVAVLYLDGVADQSNVQTMVQRLNHIEFDQVLDSTTLSQMIADDSMTLFPQLVNTERPDRVAAVLAEGKVAFFCDGSPEAIFGPATLIEFFSSLEDYYLPWHVSSAVRILRFFAVAFSVLATPIYVAVLTFHYELIPRDLLATIISSRSNIPFPPIVEAIFLELTIELLREAGARLPTKVGQTIGIVGGIVIGQASVEAGLTSNILLIIVALSALASFTTPVYQMSNTIRMIRFPFILFAAWLGGIGIMLCMLFIVTHLLKMTSLGRPYLEPLYPLRLKDWKDAFIRLPYNLLNSRPVLLRPKNKNRLPFIRMFQQKDIDE